MELFTALVLKAWETHEKAMDNSRKKSMLAWDRKIVRIFPVKAWEAFDIKPWKTMESIESVGSMVFSTMLLLIISRKHGIYANELTPLC